MSVISSNRMRHLWNSLGSKPRYTLMRVLARFSIIRLMVAKARSLLVSSPGKADKPEQETSVFNGLDVGRVVSDIKSDGVAFGLRLPPTIVDAIRSYGEHALCYADRRSDCGFRLSEKAAAEERINKKILVAQYFNTLDECPEIARLSQDPILRSIAADYLGSRPTFVGANLWWTFPVNASEEDRNRHAHYFHRDVDDFRFFKFFFYLTDVQPGDGAHVCVLGSQGKPPVRHFTDRWNLRRYTDDEVSKVFPEKRIVEISGRAGDGFAEDTWCLHKGQTPVKKARLLLQLQFALFDYGVMNDHRENATLKTLI